MKVLVLLLVPLVAGWHVWNPHPFLISSHPSYNALRSPRTIGGSPYNTVETPHTIVGSPHTIVGSPHTIVGSPHTIVGSPHTIVGSPHTIVGSPHTTVGSPSYPATPTVGSPHTTVGSPSYPATPTVGSPSYPATPSVGSPHTPVGSPYKTLGTSHHDERPNFQPTGNIVEQTRRMADSLKVVLTKAAKEPKTKKYIDRVLRVLESSNCIFNLEDHAIRVIERGTELVENAGPELLKLVETVETIETNKDILSVVRISADILRQVDGLILKISPSTLGPNILQVCGTSPEETFATLRSISEILADLSRDRSLRMSPSTRNDLERAVTVLQAVTPFLQQLRAMFRDLLEPCTPEKEYDLKAISAIGDMLDNLSDLFDVLGRSKDAKKFKYKTGLTDKILEVMNQFDDLGYATLECKAPESFEEAAENLDDVADLVEEIGIENLKEEFGIDLNFQ